MTTLTAREFNRDVSAAKREALAGPVVITDRGKPTFVLLSIEDYQQLAEGDQHWADKVVMDEGNDIDFEPAQLELKVPEL